MALLLLMCSRVGAQIPKFGHVKAEEISDMTNPVDPEAEAVFLYRNCSSTFQFNAEGMLVLETRMRCRLKILKEEGKDWATVAITTHYNKKNMSSDVVSGIDAVAYNLEGGKVVKTKMQDKYVVKEQTSDYSRTTKFTVPDVKVGTVVEYKYTIVSPRYYRIPTWYSQLSIPVIKSHCDITYDNDFQFSFESKGYEQQKVEKIPSHVSYSFRGKLFNADAQQLNIDAENMPAIKSEGFVSNPKTYASRVEFELRSVSVPGVFYKNLTTDWSQVKKNLGEECYFDKCLKIKNPFKAEMDAMNLMSLKSVDRADAIFKLLKSKLKWNETYALWNEDPLDAVKDGKGNNAQLNFILISMLKDAGIVCTPILVKFRSGGPLPFSYATLEQLDSFAVAFCDESGNLFFLDSSADYGGINVIPAKMLNDGILYDQSIVPNALPRYNLANIAGHKTAKTIIAMVSADGKIQGSLRNVMYGQDAMQFNKAYHAADDSASFVAKNGERDDYEITSYRVKDVEGSNVGVMENIRFTKELMVNGDRIYFNPMVFPDEHNDYFTSEVRKYPVEFPFLEGTTVSSRIVIPQDYEIEELPQNAQYTFHNGDLNVVIAITVQGNTISTTYKSEVNTVMVLPTDYAALREFWGHLLELNSLNVVLKKKANV